MTDVLVQPDGSPTPGGERLEPGPEEPEGKRPSTTGARLWGRVRSKLLRQKVPGGLGGDVEVVGCIQLASPYPVALVRRGGLGMGAPRYPLALGRGLGGSVGLLRELFGYLAVCSALVFLFPFFPGGC